MATMDKDLLKELGFTNNEIEVYLALLAGGMVSANSVAERTGLHRQACYDALDRMLQKGFVSFIVIDNKRQFRASKPEQLVAYIEQMKQRLVEMLPGLDSLAGTSQERNFVEVHTGKNVMRTILRDVLNSLKETRGEVLITGVDETKFLEYDRPAIERYISDLGKFGLKEKLLAMEGATVFFPGSQSEYRLIKKKFFNPNPTFIYGDKVVFVIWGMPLYAVIIRSREVADSNRKQFNILWRIAKKTAKR